MKGNFLKESARDLVALGSPIFFIAAIARIIITENYPYLFRVLIGGILFLILMFLFKTNIYSGLGLVLLIFLSAFYNDLRFTIFGIILYLVVIASLFYLKYDKNKVILGTVFGAISAGISWYIVNLIF